MAFRAQMGNVQPGLLRLLKVYERGIRGRGEGEKSELDPNMKADTGSVDFADTPKKKIYDLRQTLKGLQEALNGIDPNTSKIAHDAINDSILTTETQIEVEERKFFSRVMEMESGQDGSGGWTKGNVGTDMPGDVRKRLNALKDMKSKRDKLDGRKKDEKAQKDELTKEFEEAVEKSYEDWKVYRGLRSKGGYQVPEYLLKHRNILLDLYKDVEEIMNANPGADGTPYNWNREKKTKK